VQYDWLTLKGRVQGVVPGAHAVRFVTALLALAFAAGGLPPSAQPASNLIFGFNDNLPMVLGTEATSRERGLGAQGLSFTLLWLPGKTALDAEESSQLSQAMAASIGLRVILVISTTGGKAPLDETARTQFCTYARNAVASFPSINDVVIGNEPNASFFWRPQYNSDGTSAAPAAYEALLAECYDVLHAYRPGIDVGAPGTSPYGNDNPHAVSNISHSPTRFILDLGAAYRASGRPRRIFDTVVHHPYGNASDERPYLMHPNFGSLGEGDWNRLVSTYQATFGGTAQPVPGRCFASPCVPIWYLEIGFQTSVPPFYASYYGTENVRTIPDISAGEPASPSPPAGSPAPDQATQLRYALRLAYCQPYVEAVFNFLVRDDPNLAGYQSGLFWVDWRPKGSYEPLRQTVAELSSGSVSCAPPSTPPAPAARRSAGEVDLSWGASSSAIGVSEYTVYRDGVPIGSTSDLSYRDQNAAPSTTYAYSVQAYDAAGGTSDASAVTLVSTPPGGPLSARPPPSSALLLQHALPPTSLLPARIRLAANSCRVPNVRGKRLGAARTALAKAICRVGHVRYRRGVKHVVVVGESPRPGTRLRAGGRVNLTLGRRR
jgi:hypothetical protein